MNIPQNPPEASFLPVNQQISSWRVYRLENTIIRGRRQRERRGVI